MGPSTFIVCMVCHTSMDSPCITISNFLHFYQGHRSYLKLDWHHWGPGLRDCTIRFIILSDSCSSLSSVLIFCSALKLLWTHPCTRRYFRGWNVMTWVVGDTYFPQFPSTFYVTSVRKYTYYAFSTPKRSLLMLAPALVSRTALLITRHWCWGQHLLVAIKASYLQKV